MEHEQTLRQFALTGLVIALFGACGPARGQEIPGNVGGGLAQMLAAGFAQAGAVASRARTDAMG